MDQKKTDSKIDPKHISVRDFEESDLPSFLDYWYRSPSGYLESIGVDLFKLPTETEMEKMIRGKLIANSKLSSSKVNSLIIEVSDVAVGFHTLTPWHEGDYGIFHAHIWAAEMRGRGVGLYSYPKACRIFVDRFDLKRIIFKTPIQNTGAIRVKEKLGIRPIGEEIIGFGIIKNNTHARVFELLRSELDRLP